MKDKDNEAKDTEKSWVLVCILGSKFCTMKVRLDNAFINPFRANLSPKEVI